MEERDVDRVRKLFAEMLPPALALKAKEIEAALMVSIVARFEAIELQVGIHHAENRARLQAVEFQGSETSAHLARQDRDSQRIEAKVDSNNDCIRELIGEVREMSGRGKADAAYDAKLLAEKQASRDAVTAWFRWIVGLVGTGGVFAWLKDHRWFMK